MNISLMRKILSRVVLSFFFIHALHGEAVQLEELYKWPFIFHIDEQKVYVVDKLLKSIVIYSRKNYRPLLQFGRPGEGPGEFIDILAYQVFPEYIVISTPIRISFFSHQGKMLKEIKNPSLFPMMKLVNNFLIKRYNGDRIIYEILNEKLEKKKELYSAVEKDFPRDPQTHKLIVDLLVHHNHVVITREYIVIGDSQQGFYFMVFDHDGRPLGVISRKPNPRRVTAEDKNFIMGEYIAARKALNIWERDEARRDFVFSSYFPEYIDFFVQDEKLYVFGYPMPNGKQEVSILDIKGQWVKKKVIHFIGIDYFYSKRYFVYKSVLYYLFDNDETEKWEIGDVKIE
jgi:hypothetical protein